MSFYVEYGYIPNKYAESRGCKPILGMQLGLKFKSRKKAAKFLRDRLGVDELDTWVTFRDGLVELGQAKWSIRKGGC